MAVNKGANLEYAEQFAEDDELDDMLYARHAEIKNLEDLTTQRGTPIPALFNTFYKFIQNPSTVSVETFKRMVDTDDTVGSGVDFLTTCLASRLGRYQHKSPEITTWVNERLEEIDNGVYNCIKELLGAAWSGFMVQEIAWANTDHGFVPKKLVSLPPGTVLFETDRTGDITEDGILQYQRNYNPALFGTGTSFLYGFSTFGEGVQGGFNQRMDAFAKLGDFPFPLRTGNTYSYLSIRIPRMKCIHYAFDAQGKLGNPYGRSLLRRAYKYYVMKDAFLQMMSIALDRKGTPLTVVFADPNVTLGDPSKLNSQNNDARGKRTVGIRADLAAQQAFKNVHNDTTIILPGKKGQVYDLDFVPQDANTEAFVAAIDLCNKSIMRALLGPSLIFGNGDGSGSFALGQEHAKTFDKILDGMNSGIRQVLVQQLIKQMIAYNFPKSAWEKDGLGDFTKREMSQDEIQKEMAVVETGVNIGAIDMNDIKDLNTVRDKIGFEPREDVIAKPMVDELGNTLPPGSEPPEISDDEEAEGDFGSEGGKSKQPPKKAKAKPKE